MVQEAETERWAIFKTGGKQYRVAVGDVVNVSSSDFTRAIPVTPDGRRLFTFEEILAVKSDADLMLGEPTVPGAKVVGELLDNARTRKIVTFKKRRRKNSRRKIGHRQDFHPVRIVEIAAQSRSAFDSAIAASADAVPIPPPTETEPHIDLIETLEALRGDEGARMDKPLRRLVATDWADRPLWERTTAAAAAERVFMTQSDDLRSLAALAIYRITAKPHASDELPQTIADGVSEYFAKRRRPFFLDVELSRTADNTRYIALIRARRSAAALPAVVRGSRADGMDRNAPRVRLSGYGLVPKTKKFTWRKDLPSDVILEGLIEFENDNKASPIATIDVVLDGRRVDRRFLQLDSLIVTRERPAEESASVGPWVQESIA